MQRLRDIGNKCNKQTQPNMFRVRNNNIDGMTDAKLQR